MPGAFYAYVDPNPKLVAIYGKLLEAIVNYEREERPQDALRVSQIHRALREAYTAFGVQGAEKADEFIREALDSSKVRPETGGRLRKAIQSRPLPTTVPGARIGIASIDALDKGAVNPRSGGIYWRAQEYGLPASPQFLPKGKGTPGYFMPGYAAPSEDQFRVHPYFQQFKYEAGQGETPPLLVRKRALKARRFLEKGSIAYVAWDREERITMNRGAMTALRLVVAGR